MKKSFVLVCACFIVSCAALPALRPLDRPPACPSPFLTEKTRLIHAIEAGAGGKTRAVLIGITLADPTARTLSAAVLTPEGMALLEASFGPSGATIGRALSPFDSGELARRMMEDMALIFFAPAGEPVLRGVSAAGETVCRWRARPEGWVDVFQGRDGRIGIRRYSESGRLERTVTLAADAQSSYAAIELHASERVDYSLTMTLIESEAAASGR
jgi:hypothetical protein